MRAILALGVILFSTAAAAQSVQNLPASPDNGFFRPTPGNDPSIHAPVILVPQQVVQPPLPLQPQLPQAEPAATVTQVPAQATVAPPAVQYRQIPLAQPVQQPLPVTIPVTAPQPAAQQATAKAEQELDRAESEAERAQQKAKEQPAPINGAFTGLTDEKNR